MKYFVYFLKSSINGDVYIGSTENILKRLERHNEGFVRSTKAYRPWVLLESREFNSRSEAFQAEMYFKNHQQKEILKKKYGHVVK